jgi:uncharacterized delta-60 repeat protein
MAELQSLSVVDSLEPRRLLAGHVPDVSWGDAGFQDVPGPAYLSIPQNDGKVLVVERLSDYKGIRFHRLNANGSTDTSYGSSGFGPTLSFNFVDVYRAMQQPDGKVLVTGGDTLFVARFNSDGTVDSSFGTNGVARPTEVSQGTQPTFALGGLAMQSDGKIIAAGYISQMLQDHNAQFSALYRFNADGTVDSSFGEQGRLIVNIENVSPQVIATRSDDRIFLATSGGNFVQYTEEGELDTSFDTDGMASVETEMPDEEFRSVLPLDNGKILLGGASFEVAGMPGNQYTVGLPIIMRMNADGSVDPTFANQGTWDNNSGESPSTYEPITAMSVDSTGRIFASGSKKTGEFRLYAITADGLPDLNYATNGLVSASNEFYANDIVVLDNDKVLVSGRGAGQTGVLARVALPSSIAMGSNGVLYVRGTESADYISIAPTGDKITVNMNGEQQEYAASDVQSCQIDAFAGNDDITVSVGIDSVVNPGEGDDSTITSTGNDKITEPEAPSGKDTVRSSDGNDTIYTGDGDDRIIAGSGRMDIKPWIGDDYVTVGNGRMSIDLSSGDDRLVTGVMDFSSIVGGVGNDDITTIGSVYIQGDMGYRSLKWNPNLPYNDTIHATGGRIKVDLDGGDNTCIISSRYTAMVGGGTGNDSIVTGSGDDHIDPIGGNDTIYSNAGNDLIMQLGDTDLVYAGSGNDTVDCGYRGVPKNPTIYGDAGNDSLTARNGGVVYGGSGNDGINGARAPGAYPVDTSIVLEAHGQGGSDTIIGTDGRDKLYGGDGDDWLRGGMSADKLFGGAGNDKLSGNGGSDMILGDVGTDSLFGNAGDDKIYAQDGEIDTIDGGVGDNQIDSDLIDV